jgi:hypothetical protein
MNAFFTSIGLCINVKKTKFIVFYQMGRLNDSFIQENRPTLNGNAIERIANQMYLGLHIDEGLHTVLKKLRPMVFAIKRSRYILDDKQLWSLYHAYIVFHVCYLNPVWNSASRERCRPLFVLINKTIKAIKRLRCNHPTSNLHGGEILPFDRLSIFQDMLLIYKIRNGLITTTTLEIEAGVIFMLTTLGRQSMLPDGPIRFNNLPREIRDRTTYPR